jgi:hypothetical protein
MNFKNDFKKDIENIQVNENVKENIFNNIMQSPQFSQEEKVYPATVKNRRNIVRPLVSFAACLAIVAGSVFVFSRTPWNKDESLGTLQEPNSSTPSFDIIDKNSLTTPILTRELFVYDGGWDSVVTLDVPEMPQYEFQVTPDSLSVSGRNLMIGRDVASITSVLIGDVNFDSTPEMYVTAALQPEYGSISIIYDFATGKAYSAESVAISLDKKQQTATGLIVSKLSEDALPYTLQTEIPKDKILSEGTIVYDDTTGEFKFTDFDEPLTHYMTFYEVGNPDYIDVSKEISYKERDMYLDMINDKDAVGYDFGKENINSAVINSFDELCELYLSALYEPEVWNEVTGEFEKTSPPDFIALISQNYDEDFFEEKALIFFKEVFANTTEKMPEIKSVKIENNTVYIYAERVSAYNEAIQDWSGFLEVRKSDIDGVEKIKLEVVYVPGENM